MTIKVLAIGDICNLIVTISRYTKKSKIHLINFPKDGAGIFTYADGVELFDSWKVSKQVKRINEIADQFDICITTGIGERIAYLADLNYVAYYLGRDIDAPRFVKNSKEEWFNTPLHRLNFLERRFYKAAFENAIAHVAGTWVYTHLEKYTKKGIKMDRWAVDPQIFNANVETLPQKKEKFTFFSPQRMGIPKGTDLIWKAIQLCNSDFEVIQVNWFDESTKEELAIKKELLKNKPSQVKLVPMIKRNDMSKYYNFSDAVIGNMRIGTFALVEIEAVLCNKPVIQYSNHEIKINVDNQEVKSPFLPYSNNPQDIADIIDKVVTSKEFREKLLEKEREFVQKISDPNLIAEWWDDLFEELVKKHKTIRKNSPKLFIKLRLLYFLIANRLYYKKMKNKIINHIC